MRPIALAVVVAALSTLTFARSGSASGPAGPPGQAAAPAPTAATLESQFLRQIRAQNPAAADSFERGNIARDAGDHERAAALYHGVRVAVPGFSHAWRREGYELLALGRRPEAMDCMRKALGLDRSAWNLLGLASVLSEGTERQPATEDEIAEAEALLAEAETLEESPDLARLGCRLALLRQDQDRLRVESQRYLRLAPSDPWAHFFGAIYASMVGDLEGARGHAAKARDFALPEPTLRYLEAKLDSLAPAAGRQPANDGRMLRWIVIAAFLGLLGAGAYRRVGPGEPKPEPDATAPPEEARPSPAPSALTPGPPWAVPVLIALTLVLLLPFTGKAFHIDDPLFVWAAKQIETKPLDPYGFTVNWYGIPLPMSDVTKNPPLTSYFIAGVAKVAGMRERAVHVAFLAQALIAILGTFWLARHLCRRPLLAALIALCTPVFLVSSSTVMSDTLMLAFWMIAIYGWITGLERGSRTRLLVAAICVALGALSKYFAISLLPLLAIYTIATRRRATADLAFLLVPVAILALYHMGTAQLYGRGLLSDAASYASAHQEVMGSLPQRLLIGLAFTGGCMGIVWLLAFFPWRRASAALAAAFVGGAILLAFALWSFAGHTIGEGGGNPLAVTAQLGLFAAGGAAVLFVGARALLVERDPDSLLLSLWALGTFGFAVFVNWSINGRSILPMAPAFAILLARRMDTAPAAPRRLGLIAVLVAAALLAFGVTRADTAAANSARRAASEIAAKFGDRPGRHWFWGHWGFQYYMEQEGWKPVHRELRDVHVGDLLVSPKYNTNVLTMPAGSTQTLDSLAVPTGGWIATMRFDRGASFYADVLGPLPYAFGRVGPDTYRVERVVGER